MEHSQALLDKVKTLKQEGKSDRAVAVELGITVHQMQYIKEKLGLGRYAAYLQENEP